MKLITSLIAASLLASVTSAPVAAGPVLAEPLVGPDLVMVPAGALFKKRPAWSYEIDPSILHPKPKWKLPIPGLGCLSCPIFDMEQGVLVNPVLR